MRLAIVPLPNETKCEVVPKLGQATPEIYFVSRAKQIAVLSGLLLCALLLVGTTYFATAEAKPRATPPSVLTHKAPAAQKVEVSRPQARTFDGSRVLKTGDTVIVDGTTSPKVRRIAALPKEGVLIRRGQALHAFYLAGENSYVVMSDKETRIVSAKDIRAVVPPVLATAGR